MKDKGRILVLTDDPAAVTEVEPLFSDLPESWKVHVAQNSEDALCRLSQVRFDVIFVDLKAGSFAGVQFLHEVWSKYPETIRFLLVESMAPDLMVTCALGPHQVVQKPLDAGAIRSALERAALVQRLFQNRDVQSLVARIRTFPSRPTVYLQVVKELRSSRACAQTVAELIGRDLAISAKLLQITNSAFCGFNRPVSDLIDAVVLLGMETTAALVLGIEAFSRLDHVKLLYFSTDQVWKHCQTVAASARAIAEQVTNDRELAHSAYTAALLHDIGKLALAVNLQEPYSDALNVGREQNLPAWEVERQAFGATHAEAGAYLLSLWGLPGPVIEAVAGHHLPARELSSEFNALTALHLANAIENSFHKTGSNETRLDLEYPSELRITEQLDQFREIAERASRPQNGLTQFIRRTRETAAAVKASGETSADLPGGVDGAANGWWSRFRSLLAT